MGILSYLAGHKLYTAGISLVLAALLGIGVAFGVGGLRSQSTQTITSQTTYVTERKEDVRKIAARYGLPPSVVMADNNLTSFTVASGKQLVINPVNEPRKIPKGIGEMLYGMLDPAYDYEDAYVADIVKDPRPETVVVVKQTYFKSGSIQPGEAPYRVGEPSSTYFNREASNLKFIILDTKGKKIFQDEHSWGRFGINNQMYPLDKGNRFFLHTHVTKDWFAPWMYRDIETVYGLEIGVDQDKVNNIGTFGMYEGLAVKGRNVRIQKSNGGLVVIGNYFHYDIGNYTPDNYDSNAQIKRIAYSNGRLSNITTQEFVAAELARMLFDNELTAGDIRFLRRQHGGDLGRALDLIRATEKNKAQIIGAVASAISSGTDPRQEIGKVLRIQDDYTTSMLLEKQISAYLFTADETSGKVEPWTFELYNKESRIAGVLPHQRRVVAILDPETRQLALQGGVYLGKESPLGIDIKLSRGIDATAQPINANLVVVDKKDVMKRTGDAYERARRGELTSQEAFALAGGVRKDLGVGLDLEQSVSGVANAISTASNVVDILREHGIQNIGDLKNLMSGNIQNIPAFSDMFKELAGEKKK